MKKNEKLLDAISLVDSSLIPELDSNIEKPHRKWPVLLSAAAAVVILFFLMIPYFAKKFPYSPYGHLASVADSIVKEGSESLTANVYFKEHDSGEVFVRDISELEVDSGLVDEAGGTMLPVFRNLGHVADEGQFAGACVYLDDKTTASIEAKVVKALLGKFKNTYVESDGTIFVTLSNETIPEEYSFTISDTNDEEAEKVLKYFADKYSQLLGIKKADYCSYVEYYSDGTPKRVYRVYESSKDARERIANRTMRYAEFIPDSKGGLAGVRIYNYYCISEYMGDYEIISESDARKLLLLGNYYSSVSREYLKEGFVTKNDIAHVTVEYLSRAQGYFMPYYKFYVELDSTKAGAATGLKAYGIFYVPAVSSAYLRDYNVAIEN